VHIHVTDGRSFLRSTPQHFDVVQMTLVDTGPQPPPARSR